MGIETKEFVKWSNKLDYEIEQKNLNYKLQSIKKQKRIVGIQIHTKYN